MDCPHKKLCAPAFHEAGFVDLDEPIGFDAALRDMPDHDARESEPAHTEDEMRTDPVDVTTIMQVKPKPSLWARVRACLVRLRNSFWWVA